MSRQRYLLTRTSCATRVEEPLLSVVAEGVETDAQAAELRTLGCDGAQGFLFGRPVPEDEVDELLMPPATARLT